MNNRISYLDNLKVALILLVIFDHVGLPYIEVPTLPYTPSNPNELLPNVWRFMVINSAFFMSLFFFISGYFLPDTYDRQGEKLFVQKKFTRLGIPVLICGPIISAVYGRYYLGHLWYIENLLIFCLLYALYRKFFKPFTLSRRININLLTTLLLALFIGAGSHYIRHRYDQDYWAYGLGFIQFEPVHYFQQVSMFVVGLLAGRNKGWLEKISTKTGVVFVFLAIILATGFATRDKSYGDFILKYIGFYESFLCVFMCFALLWLFRQFCNVSHPILSWLSAQSYGAYIIHAPILTAVFKLTDRIWINATCKFFLVAILTSVLSFYISSLLRRIPKFKKVL